MSSLHHYFLLEKENEKNNISLMDKKEELRKIKKEVEDLELSPLYGFRKKNNYKPVIGEGNLNARIMFIGEAPGESEAKIGKPFVGRSGKVLDHLLNIAGLKREEVYITSVLKDRPPDNRSPKSDEIRLYLPFLVRQIEMIKPGIIVILGAVALKTLFGVLNLLGKPKTMAKIHGKCFYSDSEFGKIKIFTSYHPAAVLHQSKLENVLEEDFKELRKII
ncbi:uracil-DNA glycosylase [Candidatus Microgenomates bacterium]|jgi:DNA polymerase|nr:MAG: uracil-DNA glycosylase [Candidatus Microgenomates bacterium]